MTKEMRGPTYLVLATLADGRKHGYGIIQGVSEVSGGTTTLKAGTLYAMLDRLETEGLILGDGEEVIDGRLRRYYKLTPDGTTALAEESKQRLRVSKETLSRLRLSGDVA